MEFFNTVSATCDWLVAHGIAPLFSLLGRGFKLLLLTPLAAGHFPPWGQVMIIAMLAGLLSCLLRRLLRVEERETAFREEFTGRKAEQGYLSGLPDWKTREVLIRASDEELDEHFNTYLAQRFAHYGMVYLLPLFFTLSWLSSVFPDDLLAARNGGPYLIMLPANGLGIQGLSLSTVFLAGYLATLLIAFSIFRHRKPLRLSSSVSS